MVSSNQDAVPERAVLTAAQNVHGLSSADYPARGRPLQRRTGLDNNTRIYIIAHGILCGSLFQKR